MAYWLWPLAWALGLAWQLQQASLVPAWHGLAWLVTAVALVATARRWATPPLQVLVVAMALALVAYASTGWRALARQSQAPPPSWQGRYATIEAEVVQSPLVADRWVGVTVRVLRVDMAPQPAQSWQGLARLSWYGAKQRPQPGEVWRWPVRWRALHGLANPGGHDSELSAWRAGVWARLSVRSARTVAPPVRLRTAQGQWLTRARAWVWQRLQNSVADERTRGLLAALAVGMQSAITAQDWEIFRRTGVAHLASISGLHITMFAWLAQAFCALVWRQVGRFGMVALRWPAPAVARWGGLLLAVAYAVFSGWGVPAQRTTLMLATVTVLRSVGVQWPWHVTLFGAAWVVLVADPWALLQPGFWLSFGAVAILFARDAVEPGGGWRKAWHQLREQSLLTLTMAPLTLWWFGQIAWVGVVANLLAVPAVTLAILPLAMAGVALPWLWSVADGLAGGLLWALEGMARWPLAVWAPAVPPLAPVALAAMAGMMLLRRLPWSWRGLALGAMLPALAWQTPRPAPGEFWVTAFDVGQGSAVLVQTADHAMVVDTGRRQATQRAVLPALRHAGVQPDVLLLSHDDDDHAGGAGDLRQAYPTARRLGGWPANDAAAASCSGQSWQWDGVRFAVLYPKAGQTQHQSNAQSCVLRVTNGRQAALLPGDLPSAQERQLLQQRVPLAATVLLAGHHGSAGSSSRAWLQAVAPRWVLLQAGYDNRYGHPAPAMLDRLHQLSIAWRSTVWCGALQWQSQAPDQLGCWREQNARYWHHRPMPPAADGSKP